MMVHMKLYSCLDVPARRQGTEHGVMLTPVISMNEGNGYVHTPLTSGKTVLN